MKAIVCTKYGPPEVLELKEVAKPSPKVNEILVKIHATAVTSSDCIIRGFKLPKWHPTRLMMGLVLGFSKPRNPILGMVLVGEVESSGTDVNRFKTGDKIFAATLSSQVKIRLGAYAQYICLPEDGPIAIKPANINFEEAAAIPYGGWLALYFLRRGGIQKGQKVLIYGASGAIGSTAVQLAKYYGAEVAGICSTRNLEMVKSLGADLVIDYTKEDVSTRDERYDLILDAVPMGMTDRIQLKAKCLKALAPGGRYISIDEGSPMPKVEDFAFFREIVESGKLKPVIDRCYPLERMIEAHRYVDRGHKKGNVVITVEHNSNRKSGESG